MPKEKRASPLPAKASDYIVKMVLKNEEVLLRGQSHRLLSANDHRNELWRTIAKKVYEKYEVALSATQVKQHFNNRRKRALAAESEEKNTGPKQEEGATKMKKSCSMSPVSGAESSPPVAEKASNSSPEKQQKKSESESSLSISSLTDCSIIVSKIDDVVEDWNQDAAPKRKNISNAELRELQAATLKEQQKIYKAVFDMAKTQEQGMKCVVDLLQSLHRGIDELGKVVADAATSQAKKKTTDEGSL
ncbi:hypothetical protein Y032_0253g275 [Ancylostoma ceylanicum]|uniref:Uncharacterized protein n=1 Tax=Ancylostoma ceylanicum TaxID=53326 RepID=A0A016SBS3_9BILA|nr:hypothetical protein Y032_0253g275 [Ancylostoma ceylanicum]